MKTPPPRIGPLWLRLQPRSIHDRPSRVGDSATRSATGRRTDLPNFRVSRFPAFPLLHPHLPIFRPHPSSSLPRLPIFDVFRVFHFSTLPIFRPTRRSPVRPSSCSQMRSTRQPRRRSSRSTSRSRSRLRAIFSRQNRALPFGEVPCRGHPCQKQPSTNTARRRAGNAKSGRPGNGY